MDEKFIFLYLDAVSICSPFHQLFFSCNLIFMEISFSSHPNVNELQNFVYEQAHLKFCVDLIGSNAIETK